MATTRNRIHCDEREADIQIFGPAPPVAPAQRSKEELEPEWLRFLFFVPLEFPEAYSLIGRLHFLIFDFLSFFGNCVFLALVASFGFFSFLSLFVCRSGSSE